MAESSSKTRESRDPKAAVSLESSARDVFAELVAGALTTLGASPSPPAVSYLIGLLELRVRTPDAPPVDRPGSPTLAEALLAAVSQAGRSQAWRLRELGDRALFVSGFFGESLEGRAAGLAYYGDVGRTAYGRLSVQLAGSVADPGQPELFQELADEFGAFVDVLAEVGGRSRPERSVDLLRVHDRFLETGSARDRAQLIRGGVVPSSSESLKRWQ